MRPREASGGQCTGQRVEGVQYQVIAWEQDEAASPREYEEMMRNIEMPKRKNLHSRKVIDARPRKDSTSDVDLSVSDVPSIPINLNPSYELEPGGHTICKSLVPVKEAILRGLARTS
jgi:hypothetical protein